MEHNLGFNPENTLQKTNALGYFNRTIESLLEYTLKATLKKNDKAKCIEVNCAFGYTTSHIILPKLHPNSRIIATDISEKMIDYARRTYGNERIDFEVLDIQTQNLPIRYISEFDHVFSFPTIISRNNIRQELQNIYRMLKVGGLLHMSLIVNHGVFYLFKDMVQNSDFNMEMQKYVSPFQAIRPNLNKLKGLLLLKTLLREIGFSINYFCALDTKEHCSNSLLPYILYDLPFYSTMPPQIVDDFKNKFTNRFNNVFVEMCVENLDLKEFDKYDVCEVLAKK